MEAGGASATLTCGVFCIVYSGSMKRMSQAILVTGGAGFIGSNFILNWMKGSSNPKAGPVVNLDLLTYAGNAANLTTVEQDDRYTFVRGDICDAELVGSLLKKYQPRAIVNFAAESHVDRSIASPEEFIRTNYNMLTKHAAN